MRKPDSIDYGPDDRPPGGLLFALAVQQVLVLCIFLVAPVTIARAADLPLGQAGDLISLTMVGLALSTFLQVWRRVGSGLLVLPTASTGFVPGCVIAAREGGMAAVAGLLLASALVELAASRFLRRLRGLLPAELSGMIVLVTGLAVAQNGMEGVVGGMAAASGAAWFSSLLVSVTTLATMVGLSVWGRGRMRTMGAITGLVCGYLASLAAGLVDPAALAQTAAAPIMRVPDLHLALPSFGAALILPALITGLATTLNSTGALTAAQRLSDADWKRQDYDGLSRGLLADSIGTIVAALFGSTGVAASGSSVGLSANARATSRVIGLAAAAGFLVLALVPRFALLVLGIPRGVLGAASIYLSCSLLISGVSIMSSRLLDSRKTFTLGIAFAFAVATPALTRVDPALPDWMAPVVASPLLASALVAILLNPILRIGIRQQVNLAIPPGGLAHDAVSAFIAHAGAVWGARREVIEQAQGPVAECLDTLIDSELATGASTLSLSFNELQLDARITWRGAPIPISTTRPTKQELLMDDDAAARMAGYLIGRLASGVTSRTKGGMCEVHLVFDH